MKNALKVLPAPIPMNVASTPFNPPLNKDESWAERLYLDPPKDSQYEQLVEQYAVKTVDSGDLDVFFLPDESVLMPDVGGFQSKEAYLDRLDDYSHRDGTPKGHIPTSVVTGKLVLNPDGPVDLPFKLIDATWKDEASLDEEVLVQYSHELDDHVGATVRLSGWLVPITKNGFDEGAFLQYPKVETA